MDFLTFFLVAQAFDELLLLKVGGRVIYHGSIGARSCDLRHYFEVSSPVSMMFTRLPNTASTCCRHAMQSIPHVPETYLKRALAS